MTEWTASRDAVVVWSGDVGTVWNRQGAKARGDKELGAAFGRNESLATDETRMKHGKEIGHRKSVFDPCLILGCLAIQIYIFHGAQRSRRLVEIHTDEIGGVQFLCLCTSLCICG